MTTIGAIFTVGSSILTERGGWESFPRHLFCDGKILGIVDSNAGPATIGEMTEQQAHARFPRFFARRDYFAACEAAERGDTDYVPPFSHFLARYHEAG